MTGIVYCLENPEMPDVVKIGYTTIDIESRLRQLDTTGVPVPFVCVLALEVEDHLGAERLLHETFGDHRVRRNREFFRVSAQRVVAAMRLTGGRDVTPKSDVVTDEDSGRALDESRRRRQRFNFEMVGIAPGAVLHFERDENAEEEGEPEFTAVVSSRRRIMFEGAETSLTAAANEIRRRRGQSTSWLSALDLWFLNGESLAARRHRLESDEDD